jgi:hypothetical protein
MKARLDPEMLAANVAPRNLLLRVHPMVLVAAEPQAPTLLHDAGLGYVNWLKMPLEVAQLSILAACG